MKFRTSTFSYLVLVLSISLVSTSMATQQLLQNQGNDKVLNKKNSCTQEDIKRELNSIIQYKDKPNEAKKLIKKLANMYNLTDFETKFIKAFSTIKKDNTSSNFAPEWFFTCLCIKHGFWELADLTCSKVLDSDKSYGRYDDIDAKYMLNVLNNNNKLAKKTLWKLYEQDVSLRQALFDASLKSYNWLIASRLCDIDLYQLHIVNGLDTDQVYHFLKNQDNRFYNLQNKFVRQIQDQDKSKLLNKLNTCKEIDLFKRILSTGGTSFVWQDIDSTIRKDMIDNLFGSLGYYQKLINPNVDRPWLTHDAEEDLAVLSKGYKTKCVLGASLTVFTIALIVGRYRRIL